METQEKEIISSDRTMGSEALVNRIFRELAITHLAEAGKLGVMREELVAMVNGHPSAKRSDKAYAQKHADDMLTAQRLHESRTGKKEPIPAPVAIPPVKKGMDAAEMEDFLANIEPTAPTSTDLSMDDLIAEAQKIPLRPYETLIAPDGPLAKALQDYLASNEHPFLRVFTHEGQKYVALGTILGVLPQGKNAGKQLNVHMTVNPYRRFREVPEDIAPLRDGRQISLSSATPQSTPERTLRKFVFLVRHQPGMKIRWWLRLDGKDEPNGVKLVVLTDDAQGWKMVDRDQFNR